VTSVENLQKAVREVLETTVGIEVLGGKVAKVPETNFSGVVVTLTLTGSRGGTLVIYASQPVASAVTATMMGMDGETPDFDVIQDALGEVVNQIAGTIKRSLGATGSEMLLSVPIVVAGNPLAQVVKSSLEPACVGVETAAGTFCVGMWSA
jgi:CheY-specific phosphatase CheX